MAISTQQEEGKLSLGLPVVSAATAAHREGNPASKGSAMWVAEPPPRFLQV